MKVCTTACLLVALFKLTSISVLAAEAMRSDGAVPETIYTTRPVLPEEVTSPVLPISQLCSNLQEVGERAHFEFLLTIASRDSSLTSARAVLKVELGPQGAVKRIKLVSSSNPAINRLVIVTAKRLKCTGTGGDVAVDYPIEFNVTR